MLLYFIKSAIAMSLFYGIYRVFMEKETNYSLNRFYLVGTIILSVVLPVVPLGQLFSFESLQAPLTLVIEDEPVSYTGVEITSTVSQGIRFSLIGLAGILYAGGIAILGLTLLVQLLRLLIMRKTEREEYGPLKILFVDRNITPFSILNRVFVNQDTRSDPKINTILDHEYAHFRSFHFLDLLLLEFITIFQWFNPIAWLYVRSLKEVHEYQADAAVLLGGEGTGSYQALLVNQLTGAEVFRLANGFSKSLTKKRIIMMTKSKSKRNAWLKALFAMPVLAALLIAFSANSQPDSENGPVTGPDGEYVIQGKVVEAETGEVLPGVSIVWKGTTTGTVSDRDGSFKLSVTDKDAVIVFSFVGLKTKSVKGWGRDDVIVKMEPSIIKISEVWVEPDPEKASEEEKKQKAWEKKMMEKGEVFFIVEDMPKFQGKSFNACRPWVQEHLEYPPEAKEKGLKGVVYVSFIVNAKGKVSGAHVTRGVDPLLDKAALKTVYTMPDWTPGKQRGKAVQVQFIIPVTFEL